MFSQSRKTKKFLFVFAVATYVFINVSPVANAQRPRFIQPAAQSTTLPPASTVPQLVPQGSQPLANPGVGNPVIIQGPAFDPYAINTGTPFGNAPAPIIVPNQPIYGSGDYVPISPLPSQAPPLPGPSVPFQTQPMIGQPGFVQPGYVQPQFNQPQWPGPSWSDGFFAWPSQAWTRLRNDFFPRLLERPRFRHTFIGGGNNLDDMQIHDSEVATTLTVPNFLFTTQPIRVSPGFVFHFWDGPSSSLGTLLVPVDMPSRAFSAYLSSDYTTPWNRTLGFEFNFTVGLYTDFKHTDSDSVRFTGVGLGWLRISPTTTFKIGVEYLDRLNIKLLPAGGFFLQPSPDVRFNVYFPRPKLAHRVPNVGNYEVWVYLGGEYGGGSWTIERASGLDDQVDINDVRVFAGVEWMGPRNVTGFVEGGYVFERELVYRSTGNVEIPLDDSYMLRAGIAF